MELRDYQKEAIDATARSLRDHRAVLIVAPTGSGKSLIIAGIIARIRAKDSGNRILVLCASSDIIKQNFETAKRFIKNSNTSLGIYCAKLKRKDTSSNVIFASRDSLGRNPAILQDNFTAIIVDEAHQVAIEIDNEKSNDSRTRYGNILKSLQSKYIIGLTATPWRLSGGKIWSQGKFKCFFEKIAYNIPMKMLVERGFLVPYLLPFSTKKTIDVSGLKKASTGDYSTRELESIAAPVETIRKSLREWYALAADRQCSMFFCVTRAHAKKVQELLQSEMNISCAYIDGETENRAQELDAIREGRFKAVASVAVLTTGFDAPIIDCVVFLRPTLSASLFVQMAGRGLRIAPGKTDCLIIDCAGNFERFGSIEEPLAPRDSRQKEPDELLSPAREIEYIPCPSCAMTLVSYAKSCRYCGEVLKVDIETIRTQKMKDWYEVLHAKMTDYDTRKGEKAKRVDYILSRKFKGKYGTISEFFLIERGGFWLRKYHQRRIQLIIGIHAVKIKESPKSGFPIIEEAITIKEAKDRLE